MLKINVNKAAVKFLWSISLKLKLIIVMLSVFQIILGMSSVYSALLLKDIVNTAVAHSSADFRKSAVIYVIIIAVQIILRAVSRRADEYCRSSLENHFRARLFRTLLDRDFASVNDVHSGYWLSRLTKDTSTVADGLTAIIPNASGMAVRIVGAVSMITVLEPKLLYLLIPFGIITTFFSFYVRKKNKALQNEVQNREDDVKVYLQDVLGSMLVARSYASEDYAVKTAESKMNLHRDIRMKKNAFSNLCQTGLGTVMNGATVIGAVYCGYGILNGTVNYGTFTAVYQLINQIKNPFRSISGVIPQITNVFVSCDRILKAEEIEIQSSADAYTSEEIADKYRNGFERIQFENAFFSYKSGDDAAENPVVLENVNLSIGKGEYVAFTGSSGCGKSTVMKLMLSLYRLDSGEKSVVYRGEKMPLDMKWQRLFAYVPQGNHLMSGSIRDIVSFGCPDKRDDDKRLEDALKTACAYDFVSQLENGADTVLGEDGKGLSEGQLQRIAVARAVFSERPVLLLDESTSALDGQTERQMLANLKSMTDRTVVIVTHRNAVLEICDRVVNFE